MIDTRNRLVRLLHQHLNKPVIPNNTTSKRPPYPYVDYSITTINNDAGEGNYSFDGEMDRVDLQKQISFSINGYSRDETEAYNLVKEAWDFFKHHVDKYQLTVVRQEEIMNRTLLEVDEYERRFGFDVFIRFSDSIEKEVEGINLDDLTIIRR